MITAWGSSLSVQTQNQSQRNRAPPSYTSPALNPKPERSRTKSLNYNITKNDKSTAFIRRMVITWTPKVCNIIAFWAVFSGLGSLFYIWGLGSMADQRLGALSESTSKPLFLHGTNVRRVEVIACRERNARCAPLRFAAFSQRVLWMFTFRVTLRTLAKGAIAPKRRKILRRARMTSGGPTMMMVYAAAKDTSKKNNGTCAGCGSKCIASVQRINPPYMIGFTVLGFRVKRVSGSRV